MYVHKNITVSLTVLVDYIHFTLMPNRECFQLVSLLLIHFRCFHAYRIHSKRVTEKSLQRERTVGGRKEGIHKAYFVC